MSIRRFWVLIPWPNSLATQIIASCFSSRLLAGRSCSGSAASCTVLLRTSAARGDSRNTRAAQRHTLCSNTAIYRGGFHMLPLVLGHRATRLLARARLRSAAILLVVAAAAPGCGLEDPVEPGLGV